MNVAVTGAIGAGKSTAVRRAIDLMAPRRVGGLITAFAATPAPRRVLMLRNRQGRERIAARERAAGGDPGARFEVDLGAFDTFGVNQLEQAADRDLALIDELGVLEQGAARYAAAVAGLWVRHGRVLVVVQQRALDLWRPILDAAPYELLELRPGNRDALPALIRSSMARASR